MNPKQPWSKLLFTGTRSWNSLTLSATAVAESWIKGVKAVKLTTAATHYITAGSHVTIDGTVNYDGTHKTLTGTATTLLYIPSRFVAETTATADTVKFTLAPGHPFEYGGFRLKLSAASATAEDLTITLDSGAGAVYDTQIYARDMNGIQYLQWNLQDNPMPFDRLDELDFAWANTNTKTYGLEVFYRRI